MDKIERCRWLSHCTYHKRTICDCDNQIKEDKYAEASVEEDPGPKVTGSGSSPWESGLMKAGQQLWGLD